MVHICSLAKPYVSPSSTPATSELSSISSGVLISRCKRWNNGEERLAKQPMIRRRHLLTRADHSRKGSDNRLAPEDPQFEPAESQLKTLHVKLDAIFRFTRPHIFITKVCSTLSVALLAVEKLSDISTQFLLAMCQVIAAAFFINIYIIGLNQVADIEIDKVNKPYRPLVTGEYSATTIMIIISSSALMSFAVGWIVGSWPLLCSIFACIVLGTVYSLNVPFLRWKRIPFAATLCVLSLQVVWPLGTYLHVQTFVLRRQALFSKAIILGMTFISILAVSISVFKDIPDIEGDKLDGIQTLAVRIGAEKVFWICIGLVQFAYLVVILVGLMSADSWSKFILVFSHILLASIVWDHARSVDLADKAAIESFYAFMWKLIPAEYFLMHFMR